MRWNARTFTAAWPRCASDSEWVSRRSSNALSRIGAFSAGDVFSVPKANILNDKYILRNPGFHRAAPPVDLDGPVSIDPARPVRGNRGRSRGDPEFHLRLLRAHGEKRPSGSHVHHGRSDPAVPWRFHGRIRRLGPHLRPRDLWIDPSLCGLRGCVLLRPRDDRLRHPRTLLHRPAEEKGSLAGRHVLAPFVREKAHGVYAGHWLCRGCSPCTALICDWRGGPRAERGWKESRPSSTMSSGSSDGRSAGFGDRSWPIRTASRSRATSGAGWAPRPSRR